MTLQEQLAAARRAAKLEPNTLARWQRAHFQHGKPWEQSSELLPDSTRPHFAAFATPLLTVAERLDSNRDGATKLLLRTDDGLAIESVILRIASGRTTLCLSSQVGCAAKCGFCATGQMGLKRNLTDAEMIEQVRIGTRIVADEGRRLRNLVFMGMGEPLHNEANLSAALHWLTDARLGGFPPGRVLISTVGVPRAILRFGRTFPRVLLAVSLHSADPAIRAALIPTAGVCSLPELAAVLAEQPTPPMLEYLLLAGLTDRPDDERLLVEFAQPLGSHINLIPFNSVGDSPYQATSPERTREFANTLKAAGLSVTTRHSLGQDIAAACGQLVRKSELTSRPLVALPLA